MRGGRILWSGHETAHLIMRAFSDAFLDEYLGLMGEKVLGTVGAYELEALGIHLFSSINGSQAAILGLPLSGILEALRSEGVLLG
jgi:septum formation protein